MAVKSRLAAEIAKNKGILRLAPAWVARVFLPPGKRFGLPESAYQLGDRGGICERWLASTTKADNAVTVPDEGLSFIVLSGGGRIRLKDAVDEAAVQLLGQAYAGKYKGLGRLAKIFDYADRLPYHIHQMEKHARLVGCNSKEEAYYFPEDVDMGPAPETYFGVHPYIAREKKYEVLLPHLYDWKDDAILQHARAYKQIPGDGFHVPAGTLHAPGSALTIELQEDSDVLAMLQARVGKVEISRDLLFKDVRPEDRKKYGEKFILEMVDWEVNGDPYFYENRHTPPVLIENSRQPGGEEHWIFYNTKKFSGKRLTVHPHQVYHTQEPGAYSLLVWRGTGKFGGLAVEGGSHDLDELFVTAGGAMDKIEIRNEGDTAMIIYKFFGPGIHTRVPMLKLYQ
jgi:mannose-6-phosphate isomerase class I